jgi:uncharacterized protein
MAILGTLGTNIWVFSAAGTPLFTSLTQTSVGIQSLFEVFSNGKFLSMLAMLFGVGIAIQFDAAQRHGESWPGHYLWRTTLLFLEGLFHFALLFEGDVLMGYALTAVIVAFLLRRGERAISWGLGVAIALHGLLIVGLAALAASAAPGSSTGSELDSYATLLINGTYIEQVAFRLNNMLLLRAEPILALPYTVALFLLGVLLYRSGFFALNPDKERVQRALMRWGLGLGLPLNALTLLPTLAPGLLGDGGEVLLFLSLRYGFSALLALGYIGLVMELLRRWPQRRAWNALSGVGRTALSTYLSQSIILSLIFYGWGLGLGSQLSDGQIALLFVVIAAVQLYIAQFWLKYWRTGPLEWLRKRLEGIGRTRRPVAHNDKAIG